MASLLPFFELRGFRVQAQTSVSRASRSPLDVEIPLREVPEILLRRWQPIVAAASVFVSLVLVAALIDYSTSVYHIVSRLEVTRQKVRGELSPLADPERIVEELADARTREAILRSAGLEGGDESFNRILEIEGINEYTVQFTMTAADIDAALALEAAARAEFNRRSHLAAAERLANQERQLTDWEIRIDSLEELRTDLQRKGSTDERVLEALRSYQGHLEDHVRDTGRAEIRPSRLASVPVIYGEWQGEKYLQYGWISLASLFVGLFCGLYIEGRERARARRGHP